MSASQRYFGYAGLLPFILLCLAALAGIDSAKTYLMSYAALIFSFLGGILWGSSLSQKHPSHISLVSVSCMLWAWCWLLMPSYSWFTLAAVSFVALWLYEWLILGHLLNKTFLQLRGQLSAVAALCLFVGGL